MADQQSNDTIRQMMSGFSAMQFNLGLLPMPQAQAMGGAGQQFQAPPPPPPVMHPGDAALQALQRHDNMVQQTLQAAQVTRYQPPPSAPTPSVSAMVGMGAMNPFMAPPVGGGFSGGNGGGGYGGGGFAGGGAFAGGGFAGGGAPRMPSVFNPFAPTMPQAHFASPAMRNLQMMQHAQSNAMGMAAGVTEGVMGIGGSVIGGALGSALGPLGTMAGSWLGGKIGGAVSGVMTGNVTQDFARGRQIQQMTSPFMVSGSNLNMMTGQGMDPTAARQTATGLRHMQRDYDFERTGFNSQDAMKIMQMSGQQGLLTGAQSPDQLVAKVKEISKTVKVLMKITGDPDVRDAIHSLGEMRTMGFQGLAAQAGAVANRAAFARMAGVSQAEMGQYGQMGAGMAQQMGLAGATGVMAGQAGAGLANIAGSTGALNDLQMARAGGHQGVAQIMAKAQLSAMDDSRYLAASLTRDKHGALTVDPNLYRRAQGLSMQEVSQMAATKLRELGVSGNLEFANRTQEFKDQIAQKLSPLEMQLMSFRQAQALQQKIGHGADLAAGFRAMGMSETESRTMAKMGESREFWDAQVDQLKVRRRDAADEDRARREQYRTPGLGTRARRALGRFGAGVSEAISSPFRSISEHFERVHEDEAAAGRGELIDRYSEGEMARTEGERGMARAGLRRFGRQYGEGAGESLMDRIGTTQGLGGHAGRQMNRMGSWLGLTGESDENRLVEIASRSRGSFGGWHPFASFGNVGDAVTRVRDVSEAGQAVTRGEAMTRQQAMSAYSELQTSGQDTQHKEFNVHKGLQAAVTTLRSSLDDLKASGADSATALGGAELRKAGIEVYKSQGFSEREAAQKYEANKPTINAMLTREIMRGGNKGQIETLMKSKDVQEAIGGVDWKRNREGHEKAIKALYGKAGLTGTKYGWFNKTSEEISIDEKTRASLKSTFGAADVERDKDGNLAKRGKDMLTLAAAYATVAANSTPAEKDKANAIITAMTGEYGNKFPELKEDAEEKMGHMDEDTRKALIKAITTGSSPKEAGEAIEAIEGALEMTLEGATQKKFLQTLSDKSGDKGLADAKDAIGAVENLTDKQMDTLKDASPALHKKLLAARAKPKGAERDAAIQKVIADVGGVTKTKEISGGGTDRSAQAVDDQISAVEEMRDKVAKGDASSSDIGQLTADSTVLFSSSVKDFQESVTILKQVLNDPSQQSGR
jgi:hypothetical protein